MRSTVIIFFSLLWFTTMAQKMDPSRSELEKILTSVLNAHVQDTLKINNSLSQASLLLSEASTPLEKEWLSYTQAVVFLQRQQLVKAMAKFNETLKWAEKSGDIFYPGLCYKAIGDIQTINNNFRASLEAYQKSMKLLADSGQPQLADEAMMVAATKIFRLGNPKRAITFFNRALENRKNAGDQKAMSGIALHLGKAHFYINQKDSAYRAFQDVVELNQGNKNPEYLEAAMYLFHLDAISNKKAQAETWLTSLSELVNENDSPVQYALFLLSRGSLELMQKQSKMAEGDFEKAIGIAKRPGNFNLELLSQVYHIIGSAYLAAGQPAMAYEHLKEMDRYKDGLRSRKIEELTATYEMKSEIDVREDEISLLQLQNKLKAEALDREKLLRHALLKQKLLTDSNYAQQIIITEAKAKEAELNKQNFKQEHQLNLALSRENELKSLLLSDEKSRKTILISGIILLTILTCLVIYLLFKQYEKNRIIDKQVYDLSVMNKEVHHRVKNNLQVISSILDIQSQKVVDPVLRSVLKDGIRRIQSMGFIHQNLQNGEEADVINMKEYLEALATHLYQSFDPGQNNISLSMDIHDVKLNNARAIPIGMILNELMINAMKYAFAGRQGGDLNIEFKEDRENYWLKVMDNGIGVDSEEVLKQKNSAGYEIVQSFVRKLKASITYTIKHGLQVALQIPKSNHGQNKNSHR